MKQETPNPLVPVISSILLFIATLIVLAIIFMARPAAAQQAIIYGADGKRIGTATIDSQGTTTTRGADGRVITTETRPSYGPRACPFTTGCFKK